MSRILLLEDHAPLREAMAQALAALVDAKVTAVGTLAAARRALSSGAFDLIVSDLDLPDGSGVELMSEAPRQTPVIFVSGHLPRFRAQLRSYPGVTVREKPIPLQELQQLATTQLEGAPRGDEPPFGAGDYVQLACMGRHSVKIDVRFGSHVGSIVVRTGRLWSAEMGSVLGVAALGRLTFAEGAIVRCSTLREQPVRPSNLPDLPWEQLLLDAAREHDEATRSCDTREIPIVDEIDIGSLFDEEPRPATYETEVEQGADALLAKDYPTALRAYERALALRPGDRLVTANIERLNEILKRTEEDQHHRGERKCHESTV